MANTLKIFLGGEERLLDFSKTSFLRHLDKIVKEESVDILSSTIFSDPGLAYKSVLCFVYAGLLTGGTEQDKEAIDKWVGEMDITQIRDIQFAGYAAITGKTVDELKNVVTQAEAGI